MPRVNAADSRAELMINAGASLQKTLSAKYAPLVIPNNTTWVSLFQGIGEKNITAAAM